MRWEEGDRHLFFSNRGEMEGPGRSPAHDGTHTGLFLPHAGKVDRRTAQPEKTP